MIGRNLIVQLDNLKPSQQIAVPEKKGKCVANKQEKLSEILGGYETEGQAFQNRSWSLGQSEKPHSWSLPKRVLSDPLQLVKRIGPATFRLYRMVPLDVTVDWFAR